MAIMTPRYARRVATRNASASPLALGGRLPAPDAAGVGGAVDIEARGRCANGPGTGQGNGVTGTDEGILQQAGSFRTRGGRVCMERMLGGAD